MYTGKMNWCHGSGVIVGHIYIYENTYLKHAINLFLTLVRNIQLSYNNW